MENNLTKHSRLVLRLVLTGTVFGGLAMAGCDDVNNLYVAKPVPAPVNLTLPKTITIHEFTNTRTFDEAGGVLGIDARVEALDSFGDTTKAFGDFRFELYKYKPDAPDPRGVRVMVWEEKLMDPKENRIHWDEINRAYQFKLECDNGLPVGDKFVLVVTFSSPFTERIFSKQRTFMAGQ